MLTFTFRIIVGVCIAYLASTAPSMSQGIPGGGGIGGPEIDDRRDVPLSPTGVRIENFQYHEGCESIDRDTGSFSAEFGEPNEVTYRITGENVSRAHAIRIYQVPVFDRRLGAPFLIMTSIIGQENVGPVRKPDNFGPLWRNTDYNDAEFFDYYQHGFSLSGRFPVGARKSFTKMFTIVVEDQDGDVLANAQIPAPEQSLNLISKVVRVDKFLKPRTITFDDRRPRNIWVARLAGRNINMPFWIPLNGERRRVGGHSPGSDYSNSSEYHQIGNVDTEFELLLIDVLVMKLMAFNL